MSRSKDKGTAWETAICRYLAEHGFPNVERRALTGSQDRGDIAGVPGWVLEAKNCSTASLGVWMDEALVEQANDGADYSAVWHHRRGYASPAAGFVTMSGAAFVRLIRQAGYGESVQRSDMLSDRLGYPPSVGDEEWRRRLSADHPHSDPGDGRSECDACGKWVWPVTHSCKGVPVTEAGMRRFVAREVGTLGRATDCPR